jgi:hypothetical protein
MLLQRALAPALAALLMATPACLLPDDPDPVAPADVVAAPDALSDVPSDVPEDAPPGPDAPPSGDVPPTGDVPPGPDTPPWGDVPPPLAEGALQHVTLSADGRFVASVAPVAGGRCLAVATLATGAVRVHGDLCELRAIAPAGGSRALLLAADGRTVVRTDLATGSVDIVHTAGQSFDSLVVARDGGTAALANLPGSPAELADLEADVYALARRRLVLIDVTSGAADDFVTAYALRDVDIAPTQVVATMSFWDKFGLPNAVLQVFERATLSFAGEIAFPNCADDLQLQPEGTLAALAPRNCTLHDVIVAQPEVVEDWESWDDVWEDGWDEAPEGDPISLVDLATLEHLGNVPGFGPAAWSPDGDRVLGFTDRERLMIEWNFFQTAPFGLIVVDVADLTWDVFDLGDSRPAFRYAPDGRVVATTVVDAAQTTLVLDPATGAITPLAGPALDLAQWLPAPSGQAAFTAQGGVLYRVAPAAATATALAAGVPGDRVALRPQGDQLVWTDSAAAAHHLVDLATGAVVDTLFILP